jgi:hypothetical protein
MPDTVHHAYVGDILKWDADTGMVWAVASGPKTDLDQQACDPEWLAQAMPKYMALKGGGNVREMHSPYIRPAGKAKEMVCNAEGDWVTGIRVDTEEARKAVADERYTGVSIGVTNATVDKTRGPKNGLICGGDIIEISLVDRPSYHYSELKTDRASVMKRVQEAQAHAGDVELVTFMPKAAVAEDHAMSHDPSQIGVTYAQPWISKPGQTTPEDALRMAGIEKRDVSADEREELASKGQALEDGSFPIANEEDLRNAVQAVGRAKDPDAAKKHITARAKALNATDALPADWDGSTKKDDKTAEPALTKAASDGVPHGDMKSHLHPHDDQDDHSHAHKHADGVADHDKAPHGHGIGKATDPDITKADGDPIPEEPQHTTALDDARTAIKTLITQELAEPEPERNCVRMLLGVWDRLEEWVCWEQAEGGMPCYAPLDLCFSTIAAVAKGSAPNTASTWLPPLLAAQETLMEQAKITKAAGSTAAALLSLADTEGVPVDVAAQLRALAAGDVPSWKRPVSPSTGDGPMRDGMPREPVISPPKIEMTSAEAGGGAKVGSSSTPAFDRKGIDPDLYKALAEIVAEALQPITTEVAKVAHVRGAVAGTADAVEAVHDEALARLTKARAELEKATDDKVSALQAAVTERIDRITKLAQPSRAAAGEIPGAVTKAFATNPTDAPARPAETELSVLITKAAAGDLNAQRQIRDLFTGAQAQAISEQAYAATIEHRGVA